MRKNKDGFGTKKLKSAKEAPLKMGKTNRLCCTFCVQHTTVLRSREAAEMSPNYTSLQVPGTFDYEAHPFHTNIRQITRQ